VLKQQESSSFRLQFKLPMIDTSTEGIRFNNEATSFLEPLASDINLLRTPSVGIHQEVSPSVARHRLLELIYDNQMSEGVALDLLGILSEIPIQDLFSLEPSRSEAVDGFIYHNTLQAPLDVELTLTDVAPSPVKHFGVFGALIPYLINSSAAPDPNSHEQRSKVEERVVGLVERILLNNDAQFRSAVLTTAEILGTDSLGMSSTPEAALDQELRLRIQFQRVIDRIDSTDGKWTPLTAQLEKAPFTRPSVS
jgi:hypothetical protein